MSPLGSTTEHGANCPACDEPLGPQAALPATHSMTCPNCDTKLTRQADGTWAVAK